MRDRETQTHCDRARFVSSWFRVIKDVRFVARKEINKMWFHVDLAQTCFELI